MSNRDFIMARAAAAKQQLSDCDSQLGEFIEEFCYPDDDADGSTRADLLEGVESSIRDVAYALEHARQALSELSEEELSQGEFDDDGGEDEDEQAEAEESENVE